MKQHLFLYLAILLLINNNNNSPSDWFDSNAIDMTLKGGTSQACAACKYQRRRCSSECPLKPYFPPDQPKMFQNAHKLFGVSNILKILKNLDADQKTEAMRSIIHQANIRDQYPVHGCMGVIKKLRDQIWLAEEELHAVLLQLDMYRQHYQQQISSSLPDDVVPSQLELGMAPPNNALSLFNHAPQPYNAVAAAALPIAQQHSYSNNSYSSTYIDSKDNMSNSMWVQHPYATNNNNNSMAIQSQLVSGIQQEVVHDYDEMHPFFDTIDDRQSYIDSKEAYESSSEESLKDTTQSIEHVAENELKSAAACFSLTSVN
ncbi:hypothetical protein Dsin_005920 [Dipteronia sinensis]|uniref:LOB domain-containing protein n=1 Tax=Dipteronia sinensis TaxID=43782 RepID=A0AAE0EF26_9ROSI|nr:hypothetical protein Dsin_005920 [Dipteronia sinensis]